MASQATITMDSSFGGCDDYLQMEGQMAMEVSMKLGHDAANIALADVHMMSPGVLNDTLFSFGPAFSTHDAKFDGKLEEPSSVLEDITFIDGSGFDLETLLSGQVSSHEAVQTPSTGHEQEMSWLTASSDISALVEVCEPCKDLYEPGSPDSGISSLSAASSPGEVLSPELKSLSSPESYPHHAFATETAPVSPEQTLLVSEEDLAICSSQDSFVRSDVGSATLPPEGTLLPQESFTISVSAEDLALLDSLWKNEPLTDALGCSEASLTDVAIEPTATAKLSPKPISPCQKSLKSSKGTKALSSQEKKERKRAQNKSAATRYREKKREEARAIFEEQTGLEEINKSLKDKVTLITKEMEYMKELLIEVYRAKGLIA